MTMSWQSARNPLGFAPMGPKPAMTVEATAYDRANGPYPNAPTSCVIAVAISRTISNKRRIGAKISSCSRA